MGSSGKSNTTQNSSAFAPQLLQLYNMSKPTLQALSSQTREGLQTGGVNSNIPAVNASVASAREAYSQHTQNLRNQLAKSGLANSSFANQILGENEMSGTSQIANMPANITQDFLGRSIPTVTGAGTGALGQAASLDTTSKFTPGFWEMFMQGLQSASPAAGGLGYAAGA